MAGGAARSIPAPSPVTARPTATTSISARRRRSGADREERDAGEQGPQRAGARDQPARDRQPATMAIA